MYKRQLFQCLAVSERVDQAQVVGDLAALRVIDERHSGELRNDREADARVTAAAHRGQSNARSLIACGLQHSIRPVSYTHLDVYKRQV